METRNEINNIWTIAAKEFKDNFKSIRFIVIGLVYMIIALPVTALAIWGYRDGNAALIMLVGTDKPGLGLLSMFDWITFLLVLMAIMVTADTISLEKRDRTIYQLLSKPVERWSVVIGKYLGSLGMTIAFFTVIIALAYILTAVLTGVYPSAAEILTALEALVGIILLFSAYVSIGVLISILIRNPIVSILCTFMLWMMLFFMNFFGRIAGGLLSINNQLMAPTGTDTFSLYPWYIQIIIWIDPLSHDFTGSLIKGGNSMGLPIWANLGFILAYTIIFLGASIVIFHFQDLKG